MSSASLQSGGFFLLVLSAASVLRVWAANSVVQQPPVHVEQQPALPSPPAGSVPPPQEFWYDCHSTGAYYPNVQTRGSVDQSPGEDAVTRCALIALPSKLRERTT
jgi:hypothetical protein